MSPASRCLHRDRTRRKVLRSQEVPAARGCGRQEKCYGGTARNWAAKKSVTAARRANRAPHNRVARSTAHVSTPHPASSTKHTQ